MKPLEYDGVSMQNPSMFKSVVEQFPLGMVVKDPHNEFRYKYVNPRIGEIWGLNPEELIGKRDVEIFSEQSAAQYRISDLQALEKLETAFVHDTRVEIRGLGSRWVRAWTFPILDDVGAPLLIVNMFQDVTDQMPVEDPALSEKFEHNSRLAALGEMSGGVAHEINTPLGVISLHAEVALALLESETLELPALRHHLKRILETTHRVAKIVKTMKTVARSAGQDQDQWVDLRSILEDLAGLSAHRMKYTAIDFDMSEIPANLHLLCHEVQIGQVFLNLLNNALDAVSTVPLKCLKVSAKMNKEWFEIRFSNSGLAIKPEVQARMFESFFTTKTLNNGTGMGLSISRKIVKEHGGDLTFDAAAPQTTFVILLPLNRVEFRGSEATRKEN